MPPKRSTRSASRRSTPSSPPKRRVVEDAPQEIRSGKRDIGRDAPEKSPQHVDNLSPVVEEETEARVLPVIETHGNFEDEQSDFSEDDFSASGISDDLDDLDRDEIIESLSDINHNASAALKAIDSASQRERLAELVNSSRFVKLAERLSTDMTVCGRRQFISIETVLDKLFNVRQDKNQPVPQGKWRPDRVLGKANLALFLMRLLSSSREDVKDLDSEMLSQLVHFDSFPELFGIDDSVRGSADDEFLSKTHALAMGILTQLFIIWIDTHRDEANERMTQLLDDLFADSEQESQSKIALLASRIEEEPTNALQRRSAVLSNLYKPKHHDRSLQALRKRFPWQEFLSLSIEWSAMARLRLDDAITMQGGVDMICQRLAIGKFNEVTPSRASNARKRKSRDRHDIERNYKKLKSFLNEADQLDDADETVKQHESARPSTPTPTRTPPLLDNLSRKEIPQSPGVEHARPTTPKSKDGHIDPDHYTDDAAGFGNEEESEVNVVATRSSLVPTQKTTEVLSVIARQDRESNKENVLRGKAPQKRSLLDSQAGAVKEVWDFSGPSEAPPGMSTGGPATQRNNDDDDEDDDFETDRRTQNIEAKRKALPQRPQPSSMFVENDEDASSTGAIDLSRSKGQIQTKRPDQPAVTVQQSAKDDHTQNRPRQPLAPRTIENNHNASAGPPVTGYDEVRKRARENIALAKMAPSSQASGQRRRRPWEATETEALMNMIAEHGCSWSSILKLDKLSNEPKLQGRSQVDLKDKARNIKMDFLKAELDLPPNFELVSVKRPDKEELGRMGIQLLNDAAFQYEHED